MHSLIPLLSVLVIVFASSLRCSKEGFEDYLRDYPYKYGGNFNGYVKYVQHLIVSDRSRLDTYLYNCKQYEYRRIRQKKPDVTGFLDWTDDELYELGDLSVKYSRIVILHDEIPVLRKTYHLSRSSRDYCYGSFLNFSEATMMCATS